MKLSDICDYVTDRTNISALNKSNYISTENMLPNKSGITVASTLPTTTQIPAYKIDDVLVSNIRPYFKKIWKANFDGGCSADVLVFRAKENVNSDFLYYVLSSDKFFEYSMATSKGTKMPRGDKKSIMEFEVPNFDFPTQKKIAEVLSCLDAKIELNRRINENLEQQAGTIFKEWFVDNAKSEKRTLDEFCSIFTGRKNSNASIENGKYKFFTCSPDPLLIDSFIFDGRAIIVSGNGAYTGRTRFYNGKFDLYQRTYACVIKDGVEQDYIYPLYWFVKFELSKKIMGGTRGSAIPYIVMNDLAKFEFGFNQEIFDKVVPLYKEITETIQFNEKENEILAKIRDSLLPKLMNGEIEV